MRDETIKQILDEKTKKRKKKKPIGRLYSIRPVFSDSTIGTPEGMVETTTGDDFNCRYISDNIRYNEIKTALSDDFWGDDEFYSEADLYETEWLIKALNKETHIDYYELFVSSCWSALLNKPEYSDLTKIEAITKLVQDRFSLIGNKLNLNIADWSFNDNILNVKFEKLSDTINEGLNLPKRGSKIMRFPEEFINQCVSYGTLRPEDIIESLLGILNQYTWTNIINEQISKFVYQFQILDRDDDNDVIDRELVYDLQDEIIDFVDNLAPIGTYFGTHDGDDTNFGFWEHEDDEDDDIEWGLLCPNCGAGAGVVQDFDRGTAHCHNCNTEFELPDEELQEGLNLPKKTTLQVGDYVKFISTHTTVDYWLEDVPDANRDDEINHYYHVFLPMVGQIGQIRRIRNARLRSYYDPNNFINDTEFLVQFPHNPTQYWLTPEWDTFRKINPSESEGLNLPKKHPLPYRYFEIHVCVEYDEYGDECSDGYSIFLTIPQLNLPFRSPIFDDDDIDGNMFSREEGEDIILFAIETSKFYQSDWDNIDYIQELTETEYLAHTGNKETELDEVGGLSDTLGANTSQNVPKWEDGITRGHANPIDFKKPWQSGITRGKANSLFEGLNLPPKTNPELKKGDYIRIMNGINKSDIWKVIEIVSSFNLQDVQYYIIQTESEGGKLTAKLYPETDKWVKIVSLQEGLNLVYKSGKSQPSYFILDPDGVKQPAWKHEDGTLVSYWDGFKQLLIQDDEGVRWVDKELAVYLGYIKEGLNLPKKKVEPTIFGLLDNSLVRAERTDEPNMGRNVFRFYPDKNNQNMLIKALVYPSGKVTILQHRISFITNIIQEFNITREAFDAIFQVWFYSRYGDQIITEGLNLTKQNFEQEPITVQDIIEKYNAQHWIYNPEWYQLLPESIKMQIPHTYYYLGYIAPIDGFLVQFKSHYDPKFIGVDVFVVKDGEIINVWSGYLNANKGMTHFDMMLQKRLQNSRNKLTEGLNLPKRPQGVDKFPDDWCGEILSDGTLQPSHLIPKYLTYLSLFTWSPKIQDEVVELEREWEILEDMISNNVGQDVDHLEKQQWILQDLYDLMSDLAPKGCWFGASEGDGALFGFWEYEDETEDDEPDYTQIVQDL